jgi:membrane protein
MKATVQRFSRLVQQAWKEFQQDEADQLGAALAYYAMFSIFPLLLLLLAGFGIALGSQVSVQTTLLDIIAGTFSPQLRDTVEQILGVITEQSGTATLIGTVTLIFGASGVFQQLEKSFNKIWNIPQPTTKATWMQMLIRVLKERFFAFVMVLVVGFLILLSLIVTGVTNVLLGTLSGLPVVGNMAGYLLGILISILLSALVFAVTYRYLPHAPVTWPDVWPAALFIGVLWEAAKRVLALYIERSAFTSAYGIIGTVLVLMVWIYLSSQILFFGAELTQVYCKQHSSMPNTPPHQAALPATTGEQQLG